MFPSAFRGVVKEITYEDTDPKVTDMSRPNGLPVSCYYPPQPSVEGHEAPFPTG